MTTLAVIICFGFVLTQANEALGFFDVLVGSAGSAVPGEFLPVITFLLVGFCVFAVGGCWVVMLIVFPIFLPLAAAAGVSQILITAAIMSGVSLGYSLCFYADAVFMASAGTGVSNLRIIRTVFPYAVVLTLLSAAGYVMCGFML